MQVGVPSRKDRWPLLWGVET